MWTDLKQTYKHYRLLRGRTSDETGYVYVTCAKALLDDPDPEVRQDVCALAADAAYRGVLHAICRRTNISPDNFLRA